MYPKTKSVYGRKRKREGKKWRKVNRGEKNSQE